MKIKFSEKLISLMLAVLLIISTIPFAVSAADDSLPVIRSYSSAYNYAFYKYKSDICSVSFLDELNASDYNTVDSDFVWDMSVERDGSVMSWMTENVEQSVASGSVRYDLYIAGDGGIATGTDASYMFFQFSALTEIFGIENLSTANANTFKNMFQECENLISVDLSSFETSNVTTFYNMFSSCGALEYVNLYSWDTSNVTTMENMFYNCVNLKTVDLSSFDTSKVTTMRFMFYRCESLKYIYAGDGWTTQSIKNLNDGIFNCCYALIGGKDSYEENYAIYESYKPFYPVNGTYANADEGGYFTYKKYPEEAQKYTVAYEFTGDVPSGITPPALTEYEMGATVVIAPVYSVDGYEFSGWTSSDADISNGSFVIENDVVIKANWTRLFKLTYEYTGDVPAAAPVFPSQAYKSGSIVEVNEIPCVDGYVFVGWSTADAVIEDNIIVMPENDVTLYGYFKIPVESVEINGEKLTVNINDSDVINVVVNPEDATVKDIVFETSDSSVVTVDENGKITAVGEGTAVITVYSSDDSTKRDTIEITVKIPVTDVEIVTPDSILNVGDEINIEASVNDDASNKELLYSTSDDSVVAVDEGGRITAVGEGTATVTVTSRDDPSKQDEIKITVKRPVVDITVVDNIVLDKGDLHQLIVEFTPENVTDKTLLFVSDNENVVSVDKYGRITAVGKGTANIVITSCDNPEITEVVTVTVNVPVTDVVITNQDIELEIGEAEKINVSVLPSDADNKELLYFSSDEDVASVDEYGNVVAVGEGTAVITVVSKDDASISDIIEIVVVKPLEEETTTEEPTTEETTTEETTTEETTTEETTTEETTTEETTTEEPTTEETTTEEPTTEETTTDEPTSEEPSTEEPSTEEPATQNPEYSIEIPDSITIAVGTASAIVYNITPDDGKLKPTFRSSDESVITVDNEGNIRAMTAGTAEIIVDFGNGIVRVVPVTVTPANAAAPIIPGKYYVCFGKTDGIGWYEVSVNGGDFFPQGPNSTLEVDAGSVIVVRVQDMWINDDFTFYVNGLKVEKDAADCITLVVKGYMLIGALSMDVDVPDVKESLTLLQKIKNAFMAIIDWIVGLFK